MKCWELKFILYLQTTTLGSVFRQLFPVIKTEYPFICEKREGHFSKSCPSCLSHPFPSTKERKDGQMDFSDALVPEQSDGQEQVEIKYLDRLFKVLCNELKLHFTCWLLLGCESCDDRLLYCYQIVLFYFTLLIFFFSKKYFVPSAPK